ncbi:DUF6528 family protein [Kribbella sp. NPDC051770]|uniref:DUF6528 family protein n=1 Tax=Kribbella sp. NPDC051770 TaxID=3155413 RepID=UPI003420FBA4
MFKALIGTVLVGAALVNPTVASASRPADDGRLVAITDQQSEDGPAARIRVLDPKVADWSKPAAEKWSWSPTARNGFADLTAAWGLPSDAKLRRTRSGREVALVTDSRGLAAVASYPSGRRVWGTNVGGPANPHSIELLPNGNVAVAASTGGFVRVYTASQGAASATYAEYGLPDAHGVTWDPDHQVLWVLGGTRLAALKVTGPPAAPKLTETELVTLPTDGGHDLAPALDNHDLLWVTTGSKVYRVSKSRAAIVATEDRAGIKSVTTNRAGRQVWTTPKPDCLTGWCTDTVNLEHPAATRTLPEAQIYKARVWSASYE